jgi:sigma-B regulation protein RsbU (phosphoserine phosphatase)
MTKPHALIIEDNPQLNQIYALALREAFETESFQDGTLALEHLEDSKPALIVLDLHLSNVSGKQILERIRAEERLEEIKIILTTADVQMADMLYEQADIVLLKPVSPVQLRDLAIRLCADW